MSVTVMLLVTLISTGHLCDFLLGEVGQRRVKDTLVTFYVAAAEGDWLSLIRAPASFFKTYLNTLFRVTSSWAIFVFRVIIFSLIMSVIIYLMMLAFHIPILPSLLVLPLKSGGMQSSGEPLFLCTTVAINIIGDLFSISLSYACSTMLCRATSGTAWWLLLLWTVAALFVLLFAIGLQNATLEVLFGSTLFGLRDSVRFAPITFVYSILALWNNAPEMLRAFLPSIQIMLPITTFLIVVSVSYVLFVARPVLMRPTLLIVKRLEETKAGLLTSIASVLAALVTILGALAKM
jgi:hypothetical protein